MADGHTKESDGAAKSRLLIRGFDVLYAIGDAPAGARLTELCAKCGLSRATAIRILRKLVEVSAASYDERDRCYRIGPAIEHLSHSASRRNDLPRLAQPILDDLRQRTGETVCIFKRSRFERFCVASSPSENELGFRVLPGQKRALMVGAPGRVIVAYLPRDLQVILLSSQPPSKRSFIERELALIRREGVSASRDEIVVGGTGIASPLFDASGAVEASLTLLGPSARLTDARVAEIMPMIREAARSLSIALGYHPEAETDDRKSSGRVPARQNSPAAIAKGVDR